MSTIRQCLTKILAFAGIFSFGTSYSVSYLDHTVPYNLHVPTPWFTGPLFAPSGHTIPQGQWNFEPYIYFTALTGSYDKNWHPHSTPHFYITNLQLYTQVGLTPWLDFQITPQFFYNEKQGAHSFCFGDMPIGFDIQIYEDSPEYWYPAIKMSLTTTIPFGKYQHFNPKKNGTEASGTGSWLPTASIVFSHQFNPFPDHFFVPRIAFAYTVPYCVYIKGYNVYGGGKGTRGKVYPGNNFSIDFGFEYNFTQKWVLATDVIYNQSNKTRFSGKPGNPEFHGSPSSEQFSLAPALEYNWSANIGLIGGVWFSVAGRNAKQLVSGILALNIYM